MLVHSCIYYDFGASVVSDAKWQQWANELVKLQTTYPKEADKVIYSQDFKGFDGTTGHHLPYRSRTIVAKARQLLNYRERRGEF